MYDWEIWATVVAIIAFIFAFFVLIICLQRKKRTEKMVSNLSRYSVLSRFSAKSLTFVPFRSSLQIPPSTNRKSPIPISNPEGADIISQDVQRRDNGRTRKSSYNSFTLEIIREYEEKENELGLGGVSIDPNANCVNSVPANTLTRIPSK